jgi:hypothetical protein
MMALVLAAGIALSPPAIHQTQPPAIQQTLAVRECAWNFHVILCRWRNVTTPPAGKAPTATTTNSAAVNRAALAPDGRAVDVAV